MTTSETKSKLEVRRRERIRNLLNQVQLLFLDKGSKNDNQVFQALVEAVREDITLEELESLRADNMEEKRTVMIKGGIETTTELWYGNKQGESFSVYEGHHNTKSVWIVCGGNYKDFIIKKEHCTIL